MPMPTASRTMPRFASEAINRTSPPCPPHQWRGEISFGGYVSRCEAAVDEERRAVHIARLVARQEKRRVGDLAGLGQATHGQVHAPALIGSGCLGEKTHQQRR